MLLARDRTRFTVRTNTSQEQDHDNYVLTLLKDDRLQKSVDIMVDSSYRAPWWLPGGHLQTIYARYRGAASDVCYRRERWQTPDDDFIDLDWLDAPESADKLLVLFHGLEGCSRSHYALTMMSMARQCGWRAVVPHFRGCSGEPNRLARSYHSGDSQEINWILRRLKERHPHAEIFALGVSLGGNMLLKWLGEQGAAACGIVQRAAAVSVPLDLLVAARGLDCGANRLIYTRHFVRTLKRKILAKMAAHGLQLDARLVRRASTFREIDDLYTAPVHGFRDAEDYWIRSSAKPWLKHIEVPTLLINACNDPFLPPSALPAQAEVSAAVERLYPDTGGHVGFVTGRFVGDLRWLPQTVFRFYEDQNRSVQMPERTLPAAAAS
jgi:predicted alpha/beta-fold hydrolase